MNILVINWQDIKNPFGGGAEVHLHEIFKRIAAKGHKVDLLSCEIENEAKEETIDGINIFRRGKRNKFNFSVKKNYIELSKKTKYDIVIDDINKIPFYTPMYVKEPLLAISHHFFGKSIFLEANPIAASYVYVAESMIKKYYKNVPFAVVSESTLKEFVDRGFKTDKFDIIGNAITQSEYPMEVLKKYEAPTITYFGRLKKYKSVDHLFKAFAVVKNVIKDAKLEIIGKGDFRPYLENLSKKLNISDDVIFHGFVDNQTKNEILSKSHIVVNTSMKEGWGITNIEANACGTPVISANVPGLKDSVKEGLSGELYEYGNINELAELIVDFISNNKIEFYSNGALEWASKFEWDDSADKMIAKIEKTIDTFESK